MKTLLTELSCRLIKVAGCSTAPGNKLLMIFLFRLLTLVSRFAGAMKPLNVLPKFENHFANQTVRFQVQLEADGYFLQEKFFTFATAASRASRYHLAIFEFDFTNPTSKALVGLRPNPIFRTKLRWLHVSADTE